MVSRRAFVASTIMMTSAARRLRSQPRRRPAYDLVLRGGVIIDGTGGSPFEADVGVTGGRIAAIAPRLADTGREEIRVAGLAVAPGFIDIHSHADGSLGQDPRAESVVRQGITTVVSGQDGSGAWWADRVRRLERTPWVNVAAMVGLGTVRGEVIGEAPRPATDAERARMVGLVERELAAGACGVSSGLEYSPGGFATEDELIALARPAGARGLPYATHLRNEDDRLVEAVEEALRIARGARVPLQVSHLKASGARNWAKLGEVLSLLEGAAGAGMSVRFDVYPYTAYQTGLSNLFPLWSRAGGPDALLARLADPAIAGRIREETLAKVEMLGGWYNVMISTVRAPQDRGAVGQRLSDVALASRMDPYQTAVGLLRHSNGQVGMVGFAMSEADVEQALSHPMAMICTDGAAVAVDGPTHQGHPHPRSLGSFPRVLGRYVRERRVLTLPEAVRRMTARPARRVRLTDRGRLAEGLAADIVVFDPATVADQATFVEPFRYPVGLHTVLLNGVVTLREGERLPAPGRLLRPS